MSIRLTRASPSHHQQVTPRGRHARDMHRVAGVDDVDDFLAVAIDQRNLSGVAQGDRKQVFDVVVVHFLRDALGGRRNQFPAAAHFGHAPLRRGRRLVLQVARHHVDFGFVEFARGTPVRHAGGRAVGNEGLQVNTAARAGYIGGERLAGRALAQYAVAAGAAFEVNLLGGLELGDRHRRALGVDPVVGGRRVDARRGALVTGLSFALGLGEGLRDT